MTAHIVEGIYVEHNVTNYYDGKGQLQQLFLAQKLIIRQLRLHRITLRYCLT